MCVSVCVRVCTSSSDPMGQAPFRAEDKPSVCEPVGQKSERKSRPSIKTLSV